VQAALFHTLALICPAKHVLCRDESIIIIIIIQQLMSATITGKGAAETERESKGGWDAEWFPFMISPEKYKILPFMNLKLIIINPDLYNYYNKFFNKSSIFIVFDDLRRCYSERPIRKTGGKDIQ